MLVFNDVEVRGFWVADVSVVWLLSATTSMFHQRKFNSTKELYESKNLWKEYGKKIYESD